MYHLLSLFVKFYYSDLFPALAVVAGSRLTLLAQGGGRFPCTGIRAWKTGSPLRKELVRSLHRLVDEVQCGDEAFWDFVNLKVSRK